MQRKDKGPACAICVQLDEEQMARLQELAAASQRSKAGQVRAMIDATWRAMQRAGNARGGCDCGTRVDKAGV